MSRRSTTMLATAASLGALLAVGPFAGAFDDPPKAVSPAAAAATKGGLPDLVGGLKSTPGCLGVETARTSSGKRVIFAWFANRKAALGWYNSRMHQEIMDAAGGPTRTPLADIPDDVPILTIASITPSDRPRIEGVDMPISQIGIEMYQPLPGGASFGGTFAPAGLKIPGHAREAEKPGDAPQP